MLVAAPFYGHTLCGYNPYLGLMSARLIVNADDFGLTRGVNRAIAELFDAGSLTSATLMASGPAFDDAVELARSRPGLGVGCHVVLTDGVPLSDPRSIPSLLGRDGHSFRPSLVSFITAVMTGQVSEQEIGREAIRQIERLQQAGIPVTHLDTHKHTHIFPVVARALLYAAERTGVHAMRNPFEQPWSLDLPSTPKASRKRDLQVRLVSRLKHRFQSQPQIRSGVVRTSDGTVGISATGRLDEPTLRQVIAHLPAGTWELVCHPGYNDADLDAITTRLRQTRAVEREALLAVLSTQARAAPLSPDQTSLHLPAFELIHYGRLAEQRAI